MFLCPDIKLKRVTNITLELLNKYNINALILDVDNTLSTHHGQQLTDGLEEWLNEMQNGGIKLIVLSNSKEERVKNGYSPHDSFVPVSLTIKRRYLNASG